MEREVSEELKQYTDRNQEDYLDEIDLPETRTRETTKILKNKRKAIPIFPAANRLIGTTKDKAGAFNILLNVKITNMKIWNLPKK